MIINLRKKVKSHFFILIIPRDFQKIYFKKWPGT